MILLGIDPGFGITGYGLIEAGDRQDPSLVEAGVIRSNKENTLSERLREIHDRLKELLSEFKPSSLAIEDVFSAGAFPKSAILIGHVRGIVLLCAAQSGIPVSSYYPLQVKKALLGNGNATKAQVQRMVQSALGLDQPIRPDDCSDALAIALCHSGHVGRFAEVSSR